MDTLSDICALLSVRSARPGLLQMQGNWALQFPEHDDHQVSFGVALKGDCWLLADGMEIPIHIAQGDCYLVSTRFPYRKSHIADVDPCQLRPFRACELEPVSFDVSPAQLEGDIVAGISLFFDDFRHSPLFEVLPPVIHIPAYAEQAPMLKSMLWALSYESSSARPGAQMAVRNLVRVLIVNVLRAHLESEQRPMGWLAGLTDAKIGMALSIMHRDIGKHWTVDELASSVGMSRSAFALRFKALVGRTPLDYWLQLRMRGAAQMLAHSRKTVAKIAADWGYESEKSFGKAFKRVMGSPPTWYRSQHPVQQDACNDMLIDTGAADGKKKTAS